MRGGFARFLVPSACLGLAPPEVGAERLGLARFALGAGFCGGGRALWFGFRGLGHGPDLGLDAGDVNFLGVAPQSAPSY